jgi:hypothetical protein
LPAPPASRRTLGSTGRARDDGTARTHRSPDLFGSDSADLHGAVIPNAPGLAELVVEALDAAGFQIVAVDDGEGRA